MTQDEKDKFNHDLIQKMITRTDGFHNYANTKSTIIITFITAILAAIGGNAGSALTYLDTKGCHDLGVIFKILTLTSIALLMTAYYFVGRTVIPFTNPSKVRNFYSFIDTVKHYKSEAEFENEVKSMSIDQINSSMISLQYNLSTGLVKKYDRHKASIYFILFAAMPLIINTLIIFFV